MKKMTQTLSSFLLIALFFLSSCTHLIKLDYAQRNFNEAATIENKAIFSETPSVVSAENYYRLAYAQVKEAIKGPNEKRLKDDGVFINAMTIKALCEWKLGDYEASRRTANSAVNLLTIQGKDESFKNRDAAILASMDALTNIEEAYEIIQTKLNTKMPMNFIDTRAFYEKWVHNPEKEDEGKLAQALHTIDSVKTKLPPKHEVRRYLTLSQLAAIKNWKYALDRMNNNAKKLSGIDKQEMNTFRKSEQIFNKAAACEYLDTFSGLFPNGKETGMVQYWYYLLGLNLDGCEGNN